MFVSFGDAHVLKCRVNILYCKNNHDQVKLNVVLIAFIIL